MYSRYYSDRYRFNVFPFAFDRRWYKDLRYRVFILEMLFWNSNFPVIFSFSVIRFSCRSILDLGKINNELEICIF